MTPFRREGEHTVASFEPPEIDILIQLATEVQELLSNTGDAEAGSPASRAVDRLLPAAYGDGGEDDAEFRRFTSPGLIERKVGNAQVIVDTLSSASGSLRPFQVNLDAVALQAWLRCLTDIRLIIATGLGIEHDDDELQLDVGDRYFLDVYRWVGIVQESLVDTLEADLS